MQKDNIAHWDKQRQGFYEVWYLKLNLPRASGQKRETADSVEPGTALWLRFTTLSQKNGLKKVAEVWAVFFEPGSLGSASRKIAIKNTCSLGAYKASPDGQVSIEDSTLGPDFTTGSVLGRGHRIDWNLKFEPNAYTFSHIPESLQRLKLAKNSICKPNIDLRFSGHVIVDGKKHEFSDAPGCQGHTWGKRYPNDWAWAHCNAFENAEGQSVAAVVDVLSARTMFGGVVASPPISTIFFEHKGVRHEFNRISDVFAIQSRYSLTNWCFTADRGSLRLVGEIMCGIKDLVALTYEDTQGSFLYCNHSVLASMNLSVYVGGKLDATLRSKRTTAYETASRQRSPYVEVTV